MSAHGMIALILVIVVVVAFLAVLMRKLAIHMRKKQLKESLEAAEISFKKYKEQLVKKALEQEEPNEDR